MRLCPGSDRHNAVTVMFDSSACLPGWESSDARHCALCVLRESHHPMFKLHVCIRRVLPSGHNSEKSKTVNSVKPTMGVPGLQRRLEPYTSRFHLHLHPRPPLDQPDPSVNPTKADCAPKSLKSLHVRKIFIVVDGPALAYHIYHLTSSHLYNPDPVCNPYSF
jgi:hypothetical protein